MINQDKSVLMEHAFLLAHGLVNYGYTVEKACRRLALPAPNHLVRGSRLPLHRFIRLLDICVDCTGDPLFALRTSFFASPSAMQLANSLALNASYVSEAMGIYMEYQPIFNSGIQTYMTINESDVHVRHQVLGDYSSEQVGQLMELRSGFLCRTLKNITGVPLSESMIEVSFKHSPRVPISEYRAVIDTRFVFDAEYNGGKIARSVYDMPTINPDGDMLHLAKQKALAARHTELPEQGRLAVAIMQMLPGLLANRKPLQQQVAEQLNTSVSTLRRRLAAEGCSFQQLVNRARVEHGQQLLLETGQPIADVARAAGFSETSTFTSTFKRLTGLTPSQYRKKRQT
ncbi:HTH-type transcriptional regulator VirS [BD1-7 clade bacterium]|uniref:HTH-type transcriptional regulator VirS n=1 Tax=BD1-7 clade bacterium TaxID=2029982 RepID=A0A5S9P1N1_9GAMM|nr:HTH-type transcriptional regulator VirS [BD1-7 clade bacterium]CAA0116286.1 HTH-type transcriptional regulator VirS [BD1-7 clade bacterium]CAA0119955.1 HTH-type transcriptional regulator VirS [BD1-7 clade bacterium]